MVELWRSSCADFSPGIQLLGDEITDMAEALLKDKPGVQFRCILEEQNLPQLTTDRKLVKQILINLLGNAAKFTHQGFITLRLRFDNEYFRLSIEDTGMGIPQDQIHRIFGKFDQVREAIRDSIKGTGLGLALCQSFANLISGTLSVSSTEGKGSVFTLSLPLDFPENQNAEPQRLAAQLKKRCMAVPSASEGFTVLCIEDQPFNMHLLVNFLEQAGYRVIPAFDGEEGLRLAHTEHPDVILLDVMLPGINGWELLCHFKADEKTSEIPVIMTTSLDAEMRGEELGADGYLVKPIDQMRLLAAVKQVLPVTKSLTAQDEETVENSSLVGAVEET